MRMLIGISLVAALCACERSKDSGESAAGEKVTMESGVAFQDLAIGTGAEVKAGDKILVHATGMFADGKKFWSSYDGAGNPTEFKLAKGSVIAGWVMGIPGMKQGGKRKLWIPSKHGYGTKGKAPKIPPDSDLVFEVEVIAIL
jgi:FKBP-type peptidyl-prolyl cis-trans isomerase